MVHKRLQQKQLLSKIATGNGHGENSPYFDGWKAYETNPYHATNNPHGVIQMGLAENQLSFDMVEEWISKNPKASICTSEGINDFRDIANFQDYHGLPEFRKGVAKFMGKVRGNRVKFDPNRIVMSGGATGAHETIAFCLADPGEAFLVPVPYYPGFDRDLRWRTGIDLRPVACDRSNDFKVTREALEEAYDKAVEDNVIVKGLLITNPSNPLGTVLDKETLKSILSFINEKGIHLVCDEIYAATAFSRGFVSIAEVVAEESMDFDQDLVHIVYSLSKDMGFPGFRVGIVYSYNDAVVAAARKMSSFGLVSTQTQHLVAAMLSDEAFVDKFLAQGSARLAERRAKFVSGLAQVGIGCLEGNAGLFLWMDLTRLLEERSFDAELALWRVVVNEVKLNVSPGVSFHCPEPGWFRVCIANMDDRTVEIALARIESFVAKSKEVAVATAAAAASKKKNCLQNRSLSLSFSFKKVGNRSRFDEYLMASPHSPIPQSPLVQART